MVELDLWDEVRAMDRRFDDLFRPFLAPRSRVWFPFAPIVRHGPFVPPTDVFARNGNLVLRLELPGIEPQEDVKITVQGRKLVISGERRQKEKIEEKNYYRTEAWFGVFERHIPIPEGMDENEIHAEYKDGILEIVLPAAAKVQETPKARTIPIKVAA